jgi:hypothetical protein
MAGIYSADGGFNVTVVGENDLPIGLYAANGSFRVTEDAGPGLYAPNGAWRIGSSGEGAYTPSGALNGDLIGTIFYLKGGGVQPPPGFGLLILNGKKLTLNNNRLMMEHA